MKDELFKEVHSLVEDLINKGDVLETSMDGQKVSGYIDDHEIMFRWETIAMLRSRGALVAKVIYHLYIDGLSYCANCELDNSQTEELRALYLLQQEICKMGMREKDKSPILKFMEERRRGLK